MAVMMGNRYAALIKAGAGEDEAKRAAEEVANFELRLNGLEGKIDRLENKIDARFSTLETRMEARFTLTSWMVGVNMAIAVAVLGILLRSGGLR